MSDAWHEAQIEPIRELIEAGEDSAEAVAAMIAAASGRGAAALLRAHCAIGALFLEEYENAAARAHYESAIRVAREVAVRSSHDAEAILDAHRALLSLIDRGPEPAPQALLDDTLHQIASLAPAHRGESVALAIAQLRALLGPALARAGRAAEAEEQERASIAAHAVREPRDEAGLAAAELRLARHLAARGSDESEVVLRALITRVDESSALITRVDGSSRELSSALIQAYAALTGVLDDRGATEARSIEAKGRALATRHDEEPLALDVLRSLVGPFDDGDLQWLVPGRVLEESRGPVSNPRALDEHGHPTADGLRSEVIFGPLRDFTCACKKYVGFRHWGTICEVCRVAIEASSARRSRFGHIALACPVVHPAGLLLIARVLDLSGDEVIAIRDFDAPSGDDSGPAALEAMLRDLYLEGEAERLAVALTRGQIRSRENEIEHRAAAVAAFLHRGVHPEALILHTLPVLPPDLDMTARPALEGAGRSEVERAYGRLLSSNAEVARLLADSAPAEAACAALQRDVDALFAVFSPLPARSLAASLGDTHRPAFELVRGSVATPEFTMGAMRFSAGKAFVLHDPGLAEPLAVTCLHLFGPAGGLPAQLASEQIAWTVASATLTDAFEGTPIAVTGRAIEVPGARAEDDFSDVAALLLPSPGDAVRLRLAETDAAIGERVYLAAPVRAGAPRSQRLHPATALASTASGSTLLEFDITQLDVAGTSGAPVLRAPGEVVGMFVRFRRGAESGILLGTMVPASRLRELLLGPVAARRLRA